MSDTLKTLKQESQNISETLQKFIELDECMKKYYSIMSKDEPQALKFYETTIKQKQEEISSQNSNTLQLVLYILKYMQMFQ